MKLFLVTVNYNGAARTLRLLESLRVQTDNAFEVLIIDNASESQDVKKLEEGLLGLPPTFRLMKNKENRGFSAGNNVGITTAMERSADWVMLINNDTTVEKDFIAALKKHLAAVHSPLIGIPLQEGEDTTAFAGIVSWLAPTLKHAHHMGEVLNTRFYAIGAGVVMHRDIIEAVGLWDERYFLYFEDADYSERVHRKGYDISIATNLRILHEVSATTKQLGSPLLLRLHARNALLFNSLHAPWYLKIALPFASFFGILVQIAKLVLKPEKRRESRAIMDGIMDFWRGRFGNIA
jgi:GT2 family glycosyltransferase